MAVSGVGPQGVAIPELGVTPLADSRTELEDELPTPEDSPSMSTSGLEGVCLPGFVLCFRTSWTWNHRRNFSMYPFCL